MTHHGTRKCGICGKEFEAYHWNQKYCSGICYAVKQIKMRKAYLQTPRHRKMKRKQQQRWYKKNRQKWNKYMRNYYHRKKNEQKQQDSGS